MSTRDESELLQAIARFVVGRSPFAVTVTEIARDVKTPYSEVQNAVDRMASSQVLVEHKKRGTLYYSIHPTFIQDALADRIASGEFFRYEKDGMVHFIGTSRKSAH